VLGLNNFNDYYDTALKRGRAALLARSKVYVVHGDIADAELLAKLFDVVPFMHVLHLAAQAGVRHALVHFTRACYTASGFAREIAQSEGCEEGC
jgi:UDP-glucuronate 4-epimerase